MPSRKTPLRLLGHSTSKLPQKPDRKILETFPNRNSKRDYWVSLTCPEFTVLCPVTGQPDFGTLAIRYVPNELCVETKSLKFYLASFRSQHAFGEDVINRIADDLIAVLCPRQFSLHAQYTPRGGISLSVVIEHPTTTKLCEP